MLRSYDTLTGKERWSMLPLEREMLAAALKIALEQHANRYNEPTVESFCWETLLGDLT